MLKHLPSCQLVSQSDSPGVIVGSSVNKCVGVKKCVKIDDIRKVNPLTLNNLEFYDRTIAEVSKIQLDCEGIQTVDTYNVTVKKIWVCDKKCPLRNTIPPEVTTRTINIPKGECVANCFCPEGFILDSEIESVLSGVNVPIAYNTSQVIPSGYELVSPIYPSIEQAQESIGGRRVRRTTSQETDPTDPLEWDEVPFEREWLPMTYKPEFGSPEWHKYIECNGGGLYPYGTGNLERFAPVRSGTRGEPVNVRLVPRQKKMWTSFIGNPIGIEIAPETWGIIHANKPNAEGGNTFLISEPWSGITRDLRLNLWLQFTDINQLKISLLHYSTLPRAEFERHQPDYSSRKEIVIKDAVQPFLPITEITYSGWSGWTRALTQAYYDTQLGTLVRPPYVINSTIHNSITPEDFTPGQTFNFPSFATEGTHFLKSTLFDPRFRDASWDYKDTQIKKATFDIDINHPNKNDLRISLRGPGNKLYPVWDPHKYPITVDETLTIGENWTTKGSPKQWLKVSMSADGRYQTAVEQPGYIYVSNDYGTNWVQKDSRRNWISVSVSSEGRYQAAVVYGSFIFVSSDYGNSWVQKGPSKTWHSISISANGRYQTAVSLFDGVWVSSDYGNTWLQHVNLSSVGGVNASFYDVSMSSDGKYQAIAIIDKPIYVSSDYGYTWAAKTDSKPWKSVSVSSDGKYQTAVHESRTGAPGNIYVSSDYGNTWAAKNIDLNWREVAMSSDGKFQAAISFSRLYISKDFGNTWERKNIVDITTGRDPQGLFSVAMSANGTFITVVALNDYIYTSAPAEGANAAGQPPEIVSVLTGYSFDAVGNFPESIVDNNLQGLTSSIGVPRVGKIENISISANISHQNTGDLRISLKTPWGSLIPLKQNTTMPSKTRKVEKFLVGAGPSGSCVCCTVHNYEILETGMNGITCPRGGSNGEGSGCFGASQSLFLSPNGIEEWFGLDVGCGTGAFGPGHCAPYNVTRSDFRTTWAGSVTNPNYYKYTKACPARKFIGGVENHPYAVTYTINQFGERVIKGDVNAVGEPRISGIVNVISRITHPNRGELKVDLLNGHSDWYVWRNGKAAIANPLKQHLKVVSGIIWNEPWNSGKVVTLHNRGGNGIANLHYHRLPVTGFHGMPISGSWTLRAFDQVQNNVTGYLGDFVMEMSGDIGHNLPDKVTPGNIIFDKIKIPQLSGENMNGVWSLVIQDLYPSHTGVLNSWSLDISGFTKISNGTTQNGVVNNLGIVGEGANLRLTGAPVIGASGNKMAGEWYLIIEDRTSTWFPYPGRTGHYIKSRLNISGDVLTEGPKDWSCFLQGTSLAIPCNKFELKDFRLTPFIGDSNAGWWYLKIATMGQGYSGRVINYYIDASGDIADITDTCSYYYSAGTVKIVPQCSGWLARNIVYGRPYTDIPCAEFRPPLPPSNDEPQTSYDGTAIQNTVKNIYKKAFYSGNNLTEIKIPRDMDYLNYNPFSECLNLRDILFKPTGNYIGGNTTGLSMRAVSGVLYDKFGTKLVAYPPNKTQTVFVLTGSATTIQPDALVNAKNLTTIQIPEQMAALTQNPFNDCSNLQFIFLGPNGSNKVGSQMTTKNGVLYSKQPAPYFSLISYPPKNNYGSAFSLDGNTLNIYKGAFNNVTTLNSITIPFSTAIPNYNPFSGCKNLASIRLGNNNSAGENAAGSFKKTVDGVLYSTDEFSWPIKLVAYPQNKSNKEFTLPPMKPNWQANSIADDAFAHANNLNTVNLPTGLRSEFNLSNPFATCRNLTTIRVGNQNTTINTPISPTNGYLVSVSGILTSVTNLAGMPNYRNHHMICYPSNRAGQSIVWGSVFREDAFKNNRNLEYIEIGWTDWVNTYSSNPFSSCFNLKDIGLNSAGGKNAKKHILQTVDGVLYQIPVESPQSLTKLVAFPPNKQVSVFTIPSTVRTIGSKAFANNKHISHIIFPADSQILSIAPDAFENAQNLSQVTLPSSMGAFVMSDNSFAGSAKMTRFILNNNTTQGTNVMTIDGVLYNKARTALMAYPANRSSTSF